MSTVLSLVLALALATPGAQARPPGDVPDTDSARWERTLDRVVPGVVAVRVVSTRSFDTESARSSVATGFIVDAERGLILTNRHVVEPGPVVAEAVFLDNEEVDLQAVYRDPVHDFGFFRFDPAKVRFMDVVALPLAPDQARVGADLRIIGNDAGEKVSILAGTLARLDRDAPDYGRLRFNDFNTFYYQAASGTSGGSSGSPVIDREGRVVALNAGASRNASSSFFLPLDRVVRALEYLQRDEIPPRGTWQITALHRPFDELRRLGLSEATEARVRAERPQGTGMLVVDGIVPGGPAVGLLELGDVLVEVDGRLVTDFVTLESLLDDGVDRELSVVVERGGARVELLVPVQDLHAITPDSYLELGDGVLNELSYQQARHGPVPVGGPYVAAGGYVLGGAGITSGSVITAIGDTPVYSLDEAQAAFETIPDGERVAVRWFALADPQDELVSVVTMDRSWFPMRRCTWDPTTGAWPCVESPPAPPRPAPQVASTTFPDEERRLEDRLAPSLVLVSFDVPLRVEGVYGPRFIGAGVVVDAEQGLVVCDRDTVPVGLGDVRLVFAGSVEVPGEVVHLHPLHNLAVVRYDPSLLGDTPVQAARLDPTPLQVGDRIWHVGLDRRSRVVSQQTRVERVDPLSLPLPSPPFFSDGNLAPVDVGEAARSSGGVLADRRGRVRALWASFVDLSAEEPDAFFLGLPSAYLLDVLEPLRRGEAVVHRALGISLQEVGLVEARGLGLSDAAADRLEAASGPSRRAFAVRRVWADTPAMGLLREGDLLVAVEGEPAVDLRRIEELSRRDTVAVTISRDGQELDLSIPTVVRGGDGVDRVVSWAGTLLHEPHAAIAQQRGIDPRGVYIAWYWYGSPAARYGLRATKRILAVDGKPTPDLDSFLQAVSDVPDRGAVRLETEDLDGRLEITTLEVDLTWWPTWELVRQDGEWVRQAL